MKMRVFGGLTIRAIGEIFGCLPLDVERDSDRGMAVAPCLRKVSRNCAVCAEPISTKWAFLQQIL